MECNQDCSDLKILLPNICLMFLLLQQQLCFQNNENDNNDYKQGPGVT